MTPSVYSRELRQVVRLRSGLPVARPFTVLLLTRPLRRPQRHRPFRVGGRVLALALAQVLVQAPVPARHRRPSPVQRRAVAVSSAIKTRENGTAERNATY